MIDGGKRNLAAGLGRAIGEGRELPGLLSINDLDVTHGRSPN